MLRRRLFEKELKKLVKVGMTAESVRKLDEAEDTMGGHYEKPILSAEEDEDESNVEKRFDHMYELKFCGAIPRCIIGLELPKTNDRSIFIGSQKVRVPFPRFLIRSLSEEMFERNESTTRQTYNYLRAQRRELGLSDCKKRESPDIARNRKKQK